MQAGDELSATLNHMPRWLVGVVIAVALVGVALSWLPIGNSRLASAVPGFIPIAIGILQVACLLAIGVIYVRAMRLHWQRHETIYVALDMWKVVYVAAAFYWLEGQLFPVLPATGLAIAFYFVASFSTLVAVSIVSARYTHQGEHRMAP